MAAPEPSPLPPLEPAVLSPVLEVKRTLDGVEKRFDCRLLASGAGHAVVLWIAPKPMHVHGVDLPAGTVSFGHFWTDRPYNVYHWLDGHGRTIGFYFNLSDRTHIEPGRIEWRDLVLDVLVLPGRRVELLDEDELPAELAPDVAAAIAAGKAGVLGDTPELIAELEAASARLVPIAFPGVPSPESVSE